MTDIAMTKTQRDLVRHALGLKGKGKSYRNHFVTGEGSDDHPHWLALVDMGAARMRKGNDLSGGDDVFFVTLAAAKYVLETRESLCPEDFPHVVAE